MLCFVLGTALTHVTGNRDETPFQPCHNAELKCESQMMKAWCFYGKYPSETCTKSGYWHFLGWFFIKLPHSCQESHYKRKHLSICLLWTWTFGLTSNTVDVVYLIWLIMVIGNVLMCNNSAVHRQFFQLWKFTTVRVHENKRGEGHRTHFALHITIRNVQKSVVEVGGNRWGPCRC